MQFGILPVRHTVTSDLKVGDFGQLNSVDVERGRTEVSTSNNDGLQQDRRKFIEFEFEFPRHFRALWVLRLFSFLLTLLLSNMTFFVL